MIQILRETHDVPAAVQERIAKSGGANIYGEPNFRVVWGGSRLGWIGGRWTDRDAHGNVIRERIELRRVPKYIRADRWHIERWFPAESYGSPEAWYARTIETDDGIRIPALGPYPSRGEYEHCFTLESANGEFIPLSVAACEWIIRAVEWARRQPRSLRREAIARREAQIARSWEHTADALLSEPIRS